MPAIAVNKKARFDYEILEKYEAGLVLLGHEVKSIKTGHVNMKGSFVVLKQPKNRSKKMPELYLINTHVPKYKYAASVVDYDPYRSRKLLIKKSEIRKLIGKKQEQGLTLVPLKIYTKRNLLKLEFGLGRGKKKYDKRKDIKKRELDRKVSGMLKRRK